MKVMQAVIWVIMIASIPGSVAAQGWTEGHHYRCTATSTLELGEDPNHDSGFHDQNPNRVFTYEEESGRLRWVGDMTTWEFTTIQKGDLRRSMKAVRMYTGAAGTVLETLRIATYEVPEIGLFRKNRFPFLYDNDGTVFRGTCSID